jgi:hypothetical protein
LRSSENKSIPNTAKSANRLGVKELVSAESTRLSTFKNKKTRNSSGLDNYKGILSKSIAVDEV